jgi:heme A synthase
MFHRFAVLALGLSLLLLVWYVYRARQETRIRTLALAALVAYLSQAAVGALFVLSGAAPVWGAAHVGLAATTWALLIVLSMLEWLNSRETLTEVSSWKPQSEATN